MNYEIQKPIIMIVSFENVKDNKKTNESLKAILKSLYF